MVTLPDREAHPTDDRIEVHASMVPILRPESLPNRDDDECRIAMSYRRRQGSRAMGADAS